MLIAAAKLRQGAANVQLVIVLASLPAVDTNERFTCPCAGITNTMRAIKHAPAFARRRDLDIPALLLFPMDSSSLALRGGTVEAGPACGFSATPGVFASGNITLPGSGRTFFDAGF